jgi:hypothetical protein
MTALQLLNRMEAEGVRVTLDGDELAVDAPLEWLEKEENAHRLRCYKTELLWRLRHPEGDPDASGYMVSAGSERVPLSQLIAEGKAIVEREDLRPKTKGFDPDMWAAAVALERYDRAQRESEWGTL